VTRHVFIVDQGSQADNLRRLAETIAGRADATLVTLEHNYGVAGGRNRGTALGHGRIVVGLDNDAEFADADTVARAVAALDADPALAAIGCRILVYASGADDLSSWGYPESLFALAAGTFDATTFVGAGHAIRRTAWQECGGYDDALFFCWEEFDFCLRAIDRGWRIRYRGDIAVRHKVCPERRCTWSASRWFYYVRNRLYIARKWHASWLALTPRLAGYLLKGARNGLLRQTISAVAAASRLSRGPPRHHLTHQALAYLNAHDTAHRGSLFDRLRREVLRVLPGVAATRS
jgi:GT2 family glycosyltransferase